MGIDVGLLWVNPKTKLSQIEQKIAGKGIKCAELLVK
jgi:hypothetical protein